MKTKYNPKNIVINNIPYLISGIIFIFSFFGIIQDLSVRYINRISFLFLFSIASILIFLLYFKTRKDFYKKIKLPAVVFLSSIIHLIIQLSNNDLWGMYFVFFLVISFRTERKNSIIGITIISISEISASIISYYSQTQINNPLSLSIFKLLILYGAIEIFYRLIGFENILTNEVKEESSLIFTEKINNAEKISNQIISNILDLIFRNPKVRTVVFLNLENTLDGLRLKTVDFRSSIPNTIKKNTYINPLGNVLGLTIKSNNFFLLERFTRPSNILGYYKEEVKVQSFCGSPFYYGDKVVGVICEDSDIDGAFDNERGVDLFIFSKLLGDILYISSYLEKKAIHETSLESVNELAGEFLSYYYQKEILDALINQLKKSFEFDDFLIILIDNKDNSEVNNTINIIKAGSAIISTFNNKKNIELENDSIAQIVTYKRLPIIEKNFHKEKDFQRYIIQPNDGSINIQSFIAVPIASKNKNSIGSIFLLSKYANNFNKNKLELLEVYGRLFGESLIRTQLYEEKEKLSIKDGLTGLYSHRYFQDSLSDELERSRRSGEPVSLAILDLDYFKKVNDTHGHRVGDKVLITISKLILKSIRQIDFLGRYGGEEFVLILPNCDFKQAVKIVEKIRNNVQKLRITTNNDKIIKLTVSIGVSSFPIRALTKEELIEDADLSLYKAKEGGRNIVSYASKLLERTKE